MAVVISYARQDAAVVEELRRDIESARRQVWMDGSLTGGQSWWDTILEQIRRSELLVLALSPSWLRSNPCTAELQYALALRRPILPVRVRDVDPRLLPPQVGNAQMVDYSTRTPESAIALMNALNAWPPPGPPLPNPLPPPPPVPVEYLDRTRAQIDAPSLSFDDQDRLLRDLRRRLVDEDQADLARALLARLRGRGDVGESIAREIDAVLAAPTAGAGPGGTAFAGSGGPPVDPGGPGSGSHGPPPAAPPGGPHGPPTGGWPAGGAVPAPGFPPPGAAWQPPPWTAGSFGLLIVLSLFVPIVGFVVGATNVKHQSRQAQGWTLIVVALVNFLLFFTLFAAMPSTCTDPYSGISYEC